MKSWLVTGKKNGKLFRYVVPAPTLKKAKEIAAERYGFTVRECTQL